MAEINVVPYIDVMLVLLVIFMVTAPLLSQGVKVDLPQAQAKPLASDTPEPIIVSIDARGNYYLNISSNPNQPLAPPELAAQVTSQLQPPLNPSTTPTDSTAAAIPNANNNLTKQRQVLVKGDKNVDYGKVVQAMVILKNAGATSVGLMTQEDELKPSPPLKNPTAAQ